MLPNFEFPPRPTRRPRKRLALLGVLTMTLGLTFGVAALSVQPGPVSAWTVDVSADIDCSGTITATFTNTEPAGASNAMDVTVHGEIHTVNPGATSTWTYPGTDTQVTFHLVWTDGHPGSDTKYADVTGPGTCTTTTTQPVTTTTEHVTTTLPVTTTTEHVTTTLPVTTTTEHVTTTLPVTTTTEHVTTTLPVTTTTEHVTTTLPVTTTTGHEATTTTMPVTTTTEGTTTSTVHATTTIPCTINGKVAPASDCVPPTTVSCTASSSTSSTAPNCAVLVPPVVETAPPAGALPVTGSPLTVWLIASGLILLIAGATLTYYATPAKPRPIEWF